ncbi:hypothetical protein OC846_000250 [Tilletia horrida]|uniref:HMG box domain-containing protein n=1 Tax=Tilletia horrida TaxID=155126 RepID=A0AAN6GW55_9BASI|nr:hypothetical protein OC846_000250 [Tilletia horrida]KAK0570343.1 hypothetical protein OC861_000086 [Tilletia horrida]
MSSGHSPSDYSQYPPHGYASPQPDQQSHLPYPYSMYGGSGSTGGRVPNGSTAASSIGLSPLQHQQSPAYGHHQLHPGQQSYDAHLQSQHAQPYGAYTHHQAYTQHYGQHPSALHAGMMPSAQLAQLGIPPGNTNASGAPHQHHPHMNAYSHHQNAYGGHYPQHAPHHGGQGAFGSMHPDMATGSLNPQQSTQHQQGYGLIGHPNQPAGQHPSALHHGANMPAGQNTVGQAALNNAQSSATGSGAAASGSGSGSGAGRKRKKAATDDGGAAPAAGGAATGGSAARGKGSAAQAAAKAETGADGDEGTKKGAGRAKKRSRSDTHDSADGAASTTASTKATNTKPMKSLLKPPKQAPSAWQIFFTAELHKIKSETPGERLNVAHVAREAGQRYAALPESTKAEFQRQSQLAKEQWERDMESWKASLTPEDIKRENLFRAAQRKAGKSRKGNLKDPHAPKKPLSAYFLFLRAIRASPEMTQEVFEGEQETTKQSVLAAAKWRQLSEDEKRPYLVRAEADKARYEQLRKDYDAAKPDESGAAKEGTGAQGQAGNDGSHAGADKLENYLVEGFGDDDDDDDHEEEGNDQYDD